MNTEIFIDSIIKCSNTEKLKRVIKGLIDIPDHKLEYVLGRENWTPAMWETIERYGIPFTKENHEIFVEMVQDKLEGPDIEREWTENEYNNFVMYHK